MITIFIDNIINNCNNKLSLEKLEKDIYKVHYPFYHEDGDIYDIFLRVNHNGNLELCDFGASLMRLSYSIELNTENRLKILENILYSNCINNDAGNLCMTTTEDDFLKNLLHFSLTISKIINLDILKKENISSLFFEMVKEYLYKKIAPKYDVQNDVRPSKIIPYSVDYAIYKNKERPVLLSTINSNLNASRATALYIQLQKVKYQCTSIALYEDIDKISSVDRNSLTNIVDKQFTAFAEFSENFEEYLEIKIA